MFLFLLIWSLIIYISTTEVSVHHVHSNSGLVPIVCTYVVVNLVSTVWFCHEVHRQGILSLEQQEIDISKLLLLDTGEPKTLPNGGSEQGQP